MLDIHDTDPDNWHAVLDLEQNFNAHHADKKFRLLAKILHPDKWVQNAVDQIGGAEQCRKAFDQISSAHAKAKEFLSMKERGLLPPWIASKYFASADVSARVPAAAAGAPAAASAGGSDGSDDGDASDDGWRM